ncbi:MAG: hypothetical protein AAFX94_18655, partial [Myxococcota bacterium]
VSDDRNVFLEALLSARRRFISTFVGRSIKDNSPLPPSPVLDELREACEQTAGDVWSQIERDHPLHAHSPRYFGADEQLFTFVERHAPGAYDDPARPFVSRTVEGDPPIAVELSDFVRLLRDPSRYWFERVLGARIAMDEAVVPQRENTALAGLERWQLTDQVMNAMELDEEPTIEAGLRARGVLPLGTLGEIAKGTVMNPAAALYAEAQSFTDGHDVKWHDETLTFGEVTLSGRIDQIYGRRRLELSPSRVDERVPLDAWLCHLFGLATGRIDETVIVRLGKDRAPVVVRYGWVEGAGERLRDLLQVFALGLRLPLPIFRHASSTYAKLRHRGVQPGDARKRARVAFESKDRESAIALMYRDGTMIERAEPVCGVADAEFSVLADRVFAPAVEHQQ